MLTNSGRDSPTTRARQTRDGSDGMRVSLTHLSRRKERGRDLAFPRDRGRDTMTARRSHGPLVLRSLREIRSPEPRGRSPTRLEWSSVARRGRATEAHGPR
jgi:hypothetical protein